jgi:indolepyruvate ferredoxin oxidoreductase beta subunit
LPGEFAPFWQKELKNNMAKIKTKDFNIVIAGIGGQGLITLLRIISEAALEEGYNLAASELHGLAQRGGSVEVHFRFGKEIYSPLVKQGGANLIISLEAQEALRACYYGSKETKTTFLVNDFLSPILGNKKTLSIGDISKDIQKFSQDLILIPANKILQEKIGTSVTAGIFLLSYAIFKNLIPLKSNLLLQAMKKVIPEKYLEINLKSLELAKEHG